MEIVRGVQAFLDNPQTTAMDAGVLKSQLDAAQSADTKEKVATIKAMI